MDFHKEVGSFLTRWEWLGDYAFFQADVFEWGKKENIDIWRFLDAICCRVLFNFEGKLLQNFLHFHKRNKESVAPWIVEGAETFFHSTTFWLRSFIPHSNLSTLRVLLLLYKLSKTWFNKLERTNVNLRNAGPWLMSRFIDLWPGKGGLLMLVPHLLEIVFNSDQSCLHGRIALIKKGNIRSEFEFGNHSCVPQLGRTRMWHRRGLI